MLKATFYTIAIILGILLARRALKYPNSKIGKIAVYLDKCWWIFGIIWIWLVFYYIVK